MARKHRNKSRKSGVASSTPPLEEVRRQPHAGSILVPFLFFSGLLLVALSAYILGLMPIQTPEQWQQRLLMLQSIRNFYTAEKLVANLMPSPPTRWSGQTRCGEIGRGIWYAEGVVGIETAPGLEIPTPWRAIFVPATSEPLYLNVGSQAQGDFAAALHLAGVQPAKP